MDTAILDGQTLSSCVSLVEHRVQELLNECYIIIKLRLPTEK